MRFGVAPFLLDVLDGAADADGIDLPIGGEDADRDRDVVFSPRAVDDVLEQKRLALGFRNTAAELPAHQGVHLGVLVDRPLHADQQSLPLQFGDVRVQVRIAGVSHVRFSNRPCGMAVRRRGFSGRCNGLARERRNENSWPQSPARGSRHGSAPAPLQPANGSRSSRSPTSSGRGRAKRQQCPPSGATRTLRLQCIMSANDRSAKKAVHCGNSFDAGFYPYRNAHLSG